MMKKLIYLSVIALFLVAGCGNSTGDNPAWPGGTVPTWMIGTWYSTYNLTRATITQNSPAQYSYTYDDMNEFKGGIDVDEAGGTILYALTYSWEGSEWFYDDDPLQIRAWYLYSGGNLYTEAFYQDMQVWVRTAGASGSLVGTWQYQYKQWYGSEDNPSYIEWRKWILTLNADGTYTRQKYNNDELLEDTAGNWTYGDVNADELYLSATADIGNAWVMEGDYLVMAPRFIPQNEIAMIKQ